METSPCCNTPSSRPHSTGCPTDFVDELGQKWPAGVCLRKECGNCLKDLGPEDIRRPYEDDLRCDFVMCDCHTHAVQVSSYAERGRDPILDVFMTFWSDGWHGKGKMPWSYRRRAIWNILTRGYDHADSVCLSPAEVQELIKALHKHSAPRV